MWVTSGLYPFCQRCTVLSGFLSQCASLLCVFLGFFLGQLVSPVQTEDSGHQDGVSQWFLCGSQRSVLWTMSEEPLWRGCTCCAARPGEWQETTKHCGTSDRHINKPFLFIYSLVFWILPVTLRRELSQSPTEVTLKANNMSGTKKTIINEWANEVASFSVNFNKLSCFVILNTLILNFTINQHTPYKTLL